MPHQHRIPPHLPLPQTMHSSRLISTRRQQPLIRFIPLHIKDRVLVRVQLGGVGARRGGLVLRCVVACVDEFDGS